MSASPAQQLGTAAATHYLRLRKIAFRRLGNFHDAEDVTQNTFLLAHRKLAQFRGDAALTTWLGAILFNQVRMKQRGNFSRPTTEVEDSIFASIPDATPSAETMLLSRSEIAQLKRAIDRLAPCLRDTLNLRLRGLSIQQIADELQVPNGTVKARLSRARALLRKKLR